MDRVNEGIHGPGAQGWSIDLGAMFCIRPGLCGVEAYFSKAVFLQYYHLRSLEGLLLR